jgi:hypothetical protein
MADEQAQAAEQTPQTGTQAAPEQPAAQAAGGEQTQSTQTPQTQPDEQAQAALTLEDAMRELKDLRKENAKRRKDAQAAEAERAEAERKQAEEQGEFKKLYEATLKAKTELEAQVKAAERQAMQRKIADEVGLPAKFAGKIDGATEDEMRADAQAMADALPKPATNNDAKQGKGGQPAKNYGGMSKEQAGAFLGIDPRYIT